MASHSKGSRRPAYGVSLTGPQPSASCCKRAGRSAHGAYTKRSRRPAYGVLFKVLGKAAEAAHDVKLHLMLRVSF